MTNEAAGTQGPRSIRTPTGHLMVLRQGADVLAETADLAEREGHQRRLRRHGLGEVTFGFYDFGLEGLRSRLSAMSARQHDRHHRLAERQALDPCAWHRGWCRFRRRQRPSAQLKSTPARSRSRSSAPRHATRTRGRSRHQGHLGSIEAEIIGLDIRSMLSLLALAAAFRKPQSTFQADAPSRARR